MERDQVKAKVAELVTEAAEAAEMWRSAMATADELSRTRWAVRGETMVEAALRVALIGQAVPVEIREDVYAEVAGLLWRRLSTVVDDLRNPLRAWAWFERQFPATVG